MGGASIRIKITGGLIALAAIMALGGWLSYHQLGLIEGLVSTEVMETSNARHLSKSIILENEQIATLVNEYILTEKKGRKLEIRIVINDVLQTTQEYMRQVSNRQLTPIENDMFEKIRTVYSQYLETIKTLLVSYNVEGRPQSETMRAAKEFQDIHAHLITLLLQFDKVETDMMYSSWGFFKDKIRLTKISIMLFSSIALLFAVVLGIIMSRSITRPILQLVRVLEHYGSGDFSVRARVNSRDEIGYFANRFNMMLEQLQEAHQRLSDTIDFLPDATFVVDKEKKVIAWNKATEEMTGVPARDIIGKGDYAYSLPFYGEKQPILIDFVFDENPDFQKNYTSFEKKEHTLYAETYVPYLYGKKGAYLWVTASPLFDKHGNRVGAIESLRDVTDRKRAEELLRQAQEEKYRNIFENAVEGIFQTSPDGCILSANPSFAMMYGFASPAEMMSHVKNMGRELYPYPKDREAFEAHLEEHGSIEAFESERYRKDGSIFWTSVNARVVRDPTGKTLFYEGTVVDITRRKHVEEEIRNLNEALEQKVEERTRQLLDAQEELVRKEKLAILGRLAGIVGHELRNPLGVINNAVYFLRTVITDADDTVKEYLDIIKDEIGNSLRITSDLLDFTRTKTPQMRKITVRELIDGSLGKCTIPENIMVRVDIPDLLPVVNVDPFQMGQVFQNLITNAVQAMPAGGDLCISAARGREQGINGPDSGFIEISVEDTGEGISPESMEKVFQPLFTTKAKGIGLGLTVCTNLTEANDGRIEVKSRRGEGTVFSVILPFGNGQKVKEPHSPKEEPVPMPPEEVITEIAGLVGRGDYTGIECILGSLADDGYAAFCRRIQAYAKTYDDEGIILFIKGVRHGEGRPEREHTGGR